MPLYQLTMLLLALFLLSCDATPSKNNALVEELQMVQPIATLPSQKNPSPCPKQSKTLSYEWGTLQVDSLGSIQYQDTTYQVYWVSRLVEVADGKRGSVFLIFEGKETYSYLVEKPVGTEACLQENSLWIKEKSCRVDFQEIGQELVCPDCKQVSCAFLEINPITE